MEKETIINKMLNLIAREMENPFLSDKYKNNPTELIEGFFLTCEVGAINKELIELQEELLSLEQCPTVRFDEIGKIKIKKEYLFNVEADCLVLLSKDLLPRVENLNTIEKSLILKCGLRTKLGFEEILKRDGYVVSYKKPYLVRCAKMPVSNVCKILVDEDLSGKEILDNVFQALQELGKLLQDNSKVVICLCEEFNIKINCKEINKLLKNKKIKIKII